MNWIQAESKLPVNVAPVLVCYLEEAGPSFFTAMYSNGQWFRANVEHGLIQHSLTPMKLSPDFWCDITPPVVSAVIEAHRAH